MRSVRVQGGVMSGAWYNGYSAKERDYKYKILLKMIRKGEISPATGPCMLCNDPSVSVEYHDEDYSEPFIWEPPALLCLCRCCHRNKLHKRFNNHSSWEAFKAHVRRGGYASDMKVNSIKKEVRACQASIEENKPYSLKKLRPYVGNYGNEWFESIPMDPDSLNDPNSRPRP